MKNYRMVLFFVGILIGAWLAMTMIACLDDIAIARAAKRYTVAIPLLARGHNPSWPIATPEPTSAPTTPTPEPTSTLDPLCPYVSSASSDVVHVSTCSHVGRILPSNRVCYMSLALALADGKRPCRVCLDTDTTPTPGVTVTPTPQATITLGPSCPYCASVNSDVYHVSTCSHAARISESNRVCFMSSGEAEASGRRPCRVCIGE